MADDVKKRRIRKEDWGKIELFVNGELEKREKSDYRRDNERKWAEVDRQLRMEAMARVNEAGQKMPDSWNSVFELGELSKASEVIAADVRRITFPMDRSWFEPHTELQKSVTERGVQMVSGDVQNKVDGMLRSFMAQQHADFGFKARIDCSIKEALHHGSFVAEVEFQEEMMIYDGDKISMIGAPVWLPHSMWNCYPDESPSVISTSVFYTGSMIIKRYMPLYKVKKMTGDGWMPAQYSKIKNEEHKTGQIETKDVCLLTYYGDINIERADGDIYLPNSKAILANGTIVYYAPGKLPYPPIIYGGYEKQDIRDPYCTSPIIKLSPIQKIATICANKFIDSVSLRVEPPLVYDGNDPYFVQSDGPTIAPGVKTASKGSTDFKVIEVGDPSFALSGLEMALRQMQEGLGVSAVRSGVPNSDRQTATEVNKVAQGAEVRTIDFIDKLNANLRSYLYMQHELNKKYCERYSFYNAEMGTPDFVRIVNKDIPRNAHFEVVGSKGILGEEQRAGRTANVVAFASANPLFAPLLKPDKILVEMFQDAGNKNPERFINVGGTQMKIPPQFIAQMQQHQQIIQQLQAKLQEAESGVKEKMAELQLERQTTGAELKLERDRMMMEHQDRVREFSAENALKQTELRAEIQLEREKFMAELRQMAADLQLERAKLAGEFKLKAAAAEQKTRDSGDGKSKTVVPNITINMPSGKRKVKFNPDDSATIEEA